MERPALVRITRPPRAEPRHATGLRRAGRAPRARAPPRPVRPARRTTGWRARAPRPAWQPRGRRRARPPAARPSRPACPARRACAPLTSAAPSRASGGKRGLRARARRGARPRGRRRARAPRQSPTSAAAAWYQGDAAACLAGRCQYVNSRKNAAASASPVQCGSAAGRPCAPATQLLPPPIASMQSLQEG